MTYKFNSDKPLTLALVRLYQGKLVKVRYENRDIPIYYEGIIRPLTRTSCWVGKEVLSNHRISEIEFLD